MKKVLILALVLSLIPALVRNYDAIDARGLIVLATSEYGDVTMNPYDKDGYFITPRIAKWLLLNFDFPYERCSIAFGCDQPLISFVGASLDYSGNDSTEVGFEILHHLIERGEDVDSRNYGFTPLHEAVLSCNSRYIKILIEAGANIEAKIDNPEIKSDGLSVTELANSIDNSKDESLGLSCEALRSILSENET